MTHTLTTKAPKTRSTYTVWVIGHGAVRDESGDLCRYASIALAHDAARQTGIAAPSWTVHCGRSIVARSWETGAEVSATAERNSR